MSRGEMSHGEKRRMGRNVAGRNVAGRNVAGRNVFWGETSHLCKFWEKVGRNDFRGETSQGEMSQGETSLGEKRRIALKTVPFFVVTVFRPLLKSLFLLKKVLFWPF